MNTEYIIYLLILIISFCIFSMIHHAFSIIFDSDEYLGYDEENLEENHFVSKEDAVWKRI